MACSGLRNVFHRVEPGRRAVVTQPQLLLDDSTAPGPYTVDNIPESRTCQTLLLTGHLPAHFRERTDVEDGRYFDQVRKFCPGDAVKVETTERRQGAHERVEARD